MNVPFIKRRMATFVTKKPFPNEIPPFLKRFQYFDGIGIPELGFRRTSHYENLFLTFRNVSLNRFLQHGCVLSLNRLENRSMLLLSLFALFFIVTIIEACNLRMEIEGSVQLDETIVTGSLQEILMKFRIEIIVSKVVEMFGRSIEQLDGLVDILFKRPYVSERGIPYDVAAEAGFEQQPYGKHFEHVFDCEWRYICAFLGFDGYQSFRRQPGNRIFDRRAADPQLF
jgi:hypothetical protein